MLDYKSIVRLKRLGLNNSAIACSVKCKWDSVQRIVARCESVWGSVDGVPENLSNEDCGYPLQHQEECRSGLSAARQRKDSGETAAGLLEERTLG